MRRALLGLALVAAVAPFVAQSPPSVASSPTGMIVDGHARFEVLTPTLIRLEYAADGNFEDATTFNVVNRDFPVPPYTTDVANGWREIRTGRMTVRYQEGSGPFTTQNTVVSVRIGGAWQSGNPSWPPAPGACAFGAACQTEEGRLTGGESVNYDHTGFTGRGFTADYGQVSAADTFALTGVPSGGTYPFRVRYANGGGGTQTLSVRVGGSVVGQLSLPPTGSWDSWSTASIDVPLAEGANTVGSLCAAGDSCNVNLDSAAVTRPGADYPVSSPSAPVTEDGQLGGWTRGLDAYTNQAGADVSDVQLHPGILNRRGWSLLDDTYTALRTGDDWPQPRPNHDGAYQDGYLFGYGHDYQQALRDLRALTGPADMLPEWAFGVWFSRYFAYSTSDYENQLIPAFRAHGVPLDALVVDTDWKSPQNWDGWNWNTNLFPDPQAFLTWAKQQGLNVTLNVHAGIDGSDPKFPAAQQTAQGRLQHAAQCFSPQCYRFDWSDPDQARAWFDLHHPFEQQGVRQWWLDWCCTDSVVDMPGLTPDSWINELYARDLDARGLRGFVLARLGSSFEDYRGAPAPGPWGEHRSTVHFTGDTEATWQTLAFEAQMTTAEASIGEPYVSHDIGSFKGKHLPDDLYDRWVQFATFQPILRLHSDHGDRLPWEYGAAQDPATHFLRLREALVPYTYTLAEQATRTGLPIARPLYLDYPDQDAAYDHSTEYLYGPDVLVAPVTTPGAVANQQVWFPPGRWTDYFTGATFTGPGTATLSEPLDRMPVFVRAGGIVPEQPAMNHVGATPVDPLTLNVFAGDSGTFSMYEDAGEGFGYRQGESSHTPLRYDEGTTSSTMTIGPRSGSYPGVLANRSYRMRLVDVSAPHRVTLDGSTLKKVSPGSTSPGWWYDAGSTTLHVDTPQVTTTRQATITQFGGRPVTRGQSAAVALTLGPSTPTTLSPGQSVTVAETVQNAGPGAITGVHASLSGPADWTITPTDATHVGRVPAGSAETMHWTVSAPASQSGSVTAALKGTVQYVSNDSAATVTAYQGPPPLIAPHVDSAQPSSGAAGDVITLHGENFGDTQGSSYLLFADGGTSWGAPFDGAAFTVNSWSDTKISFTIPTPSGPGGVWHVNPGDTATVDVNTAGGTSNTVPIAITG